MNSHIVGTVTPNQIKRLIRKELDQAFQDGFDKRGKIDTIALNDTDNYGPKRIERLDKHVGELIDEYNGYADLREGVADMKIKQRLKQIGIGLR